MVAALVVRGRRKAWWWWWRGKSLTNFVSFYGCWLFHYEIILLFPSDVNKSLDLFDTLFLLLVFSFPQFFGCISFTPHSPSFYDIIYKISSRNGGNKMRTSAYNSSPSEQGHAYETPDEDKVGAVWWCIMACIWWCCWYLVGKHFVVENSVSELTISDDDEGDKYGD